MRPRARKSSVATHSPHIVAKLDPEQVIVAERVEGATRLKRLEESVLKRGSMTSISLNCGLPDTSADVPNRSQANL